MTRVTVLAAVCCAALMLTVSNVNAQCASCGQAAAPTFSQSYAVPAVSYATPTYATPVYAEPQMSYATPISTGCSSCAGCGTDSQVSYVAPVSYAAPITDGCSACGTASYAAPIAVAAPVATGCDCCVTSNQRQIVRPRVVQRVVSQRRVNNCSTCAPCNCCN